MESLLNNLPLLIGGSFGLIFAFVWFVKSFHVIGPSEVGLVNKQFSLKGGDSNSLIAFNGEAGYQAELLRTGVKFRLWPMYSVTKHPFVQIPADGIGVVVAQVGLPPVNGAKSAVYKPEFGSFEDLHTFVNGGGQQGVQRPVLRPGQLLALHPIAFLVRTRDGIFGVPVSAESKERLDLKGVPPERFNLFKVEPKCDDEGKVLDVVGIVRALDGTPLDNSDIACRLGGFKALADLESAGAKDPQLVEAQLASQNILHNNYQDYQAFVDAGGRIGLQHDPLLYGEYTLNPYLVIVETVPMLVIKQGEVAVITSYVGLPSEDKSGENFKHGHIVRPCHRGIWQEPIRTGKVPLNPRCYRVEIVPTQILTLNWADATSAAHSLDKNLSSIRAKSKEGFEFMIDLQVQIHVPDTKAPLVISRVGSMQNLVNEVLQAAVGNYFRDTLQGMQAIEFIERRRQVQEQATAYISKQLEQYHIQTVGVFIQDVTFPEELVKVLQQREIANQEIATYEMQQRAEEQRIQMEKTRGLADQQATLARSEVAIQIKGNEAQARIKEAEGEAAFLQQVGTARGAEVRAVGLAKAEGYEAQVKALGQGNTALVNVLNAVAGSSTRLVPDVLTVGGGSGGSFEGLASVLMGAVKKGLGTQLPHPSATIVTDVASKPAGTNGAQAS